MDIDKQLKENIKVEMSQLPKETREVINEFLFQNIFKEIGKEYKLTDDEIKTLEVETILVLIGLISQQSYAQNIENNIGLSEQEAKEIDQEISNQIFQPIYEKTIEKIKKGSTYYKPDWKQTINFIVSGGNYSVFIEEVASKNNPKVSYGEIIKK